MRSREEVIRGLERCLARTCPGIGSKEYDECEYTIGLYCGMDNVMRDALELLKAQEPATVEPKRIDLADETKAWLDKMDAVDALGNIADICIDWDGYRTANGLGGLINEVWAYARYCADRLAKAQEPREPHYTKLEYIVNNMPVVINHPECPRCYDNGLMLWDAEIEKGAAYCKRCGQAVKWE